MKKMDLKQQLADAQQTNQALRFELKAAFEELEKTNSELLQLTLELDDRVAERTKSLQQSEDELKKHRDQLQEMVEQRTADLNDANRKLEQKLDELQVSEERFKSLVLTIPDIVYKIDKQGCFTFINDAIGKLGYESEDLLGKHFSEIILPADVEEISRETVLPNYKNQTTGDKNAPKLFDERRTGQRKTTGLEVRLVSKTKELKPGYIKGLGKDFVLVEVNSAGIYGVSDATKKRIFIGTVGVIRDITARKKMEDELKKAHDDLERKVEVRTLALKKSHAQLIQAEKIGALGTLTAGIAHELNNPMMGMLNFVQYCLKHIPEENQLHAILTDTERETKRCIAIVKNLLTFSRIEDEDKEEFQKATIDRLINRVLRLLSYRIQKENVQVDLRYGHDMPKIWMKITNLQQVFLNLIGNALDAMVKSNHKQLTLNISVANGFVKVGIKDNGSGIEPEVLPFIFDPFFTTKPVGKGTGLGLSVCQSIIRNHGGEVHCVSKPGKGTTFEVLLPIEKVELETGNDSNAECGTRNAE